MSILAAALCAGVDGARAQNASERAETGESEQDSELSPLADAHAQFADVLTPAFDPWRDVGLYGQLLTYGGVDGWRYGGSVYAGADWSPATQGGFIFRVFGADGLDDFRTRFATYRSETARAALLPGWHIQAGKLDVKLFAGGDYMVRIPLRPALEAPLQMFGARATVDVWWEPAEQWMLSGSASATTIESGLSARLASGWRLPFAWIGPEVLATHDIFNTQYRAGAHLTGVRVGITEWSVAGGYARDSFGRSSPYGRIGFTLRP